MEVITLAPEESQRWINLVQPIQDDFVSRMNTQGYQGQEILETVKRLAEQYNQEYQ